jgi:hypothetical protein
MAGLTQARQQAILDAEFVAGDYFAWSENGTSESSYLARTAVSAWTSASAANPSEKSNNGALLSAACSGDAKTFTHWAVFSASTAGTQKTDWTALTQSQLLNTGGKLSIAANALKVTLD